MSNTVSLPPHLESIARALLDVFAPGADISLDAIGHAIGDASITVDEIEIVFRRLELEGRTVAKELNGAVGTKRLRAVIDAGRRLRDKLGRTPTRAEIGTETGLSEDEIQHALALARVMQR